MEMDRYEDQNRLGLCRLSVKEGVIFYAVDSRERIYQIREIFKDPERKLLVVYNEINSINHEQFSAYMDTFIDRLYFGEFQIIDTERDEKMYEDLRERRKKLDEIANKVLVEDVGIKVRKYLSEIIEKRPDQDIKFYINEFLNKCFVNMEGFKIESFDYFERTVNSGTGRMHDNDTSTYSNKAVILYSYLVDPTKD